MSAHCPPSQSAKISSWRGGLLPRVSRRSEFTWTRQRKTAVPSGTYRNASDGEGAATMYSIPSARRHFAKPYIDLRPARRTGIIEASALNDAPRPCHCPAEYWKKGLASFRNRIGSGLLRRFADQRTKPSCCRIRNCCTGQCLRLVSIFGQ